MSHRHVVVPDTIAFNQLIFYHSTLIKELQDEAEAAKMAAEAARRSG